MKLYNELKKTGILLIAILTLSALSTEVLASNALVTGGYDGKTKRTCHAMYTGKVTGINYSQNTSTGQMDKYLPIPIAARVQFGFGAHFTARGSCGKLVPNRCRKRARDTLIKCARAQTQSPNTVPQECRLDNIGNYPSQQHMSAIKKNACKPLKTENGVLVTTFPKPYLVHLLLSVYIIGDKGCGKKGLGKTTLVDGRNVPIVGYKNDYFALPLKRYTITCD